MIRVQKIIGILMTWVAATGGVVAQEPATNFPAAFPGLPKWEVGLLGLSSRVPLYRGSDEYTWYTFPFPYFIYRGDYIKADRDGVRGLFYKGYRFELELSMSGNPPVQDTGGARAGMPELDPLIELGPAARFYVHHGEKIRALFLEAAGRGVFSIDLDNLAPGYEGLRGDLSLVLAGIKPKAGSPWTAGVKTGLGFTDRDYNRYFYDVDEAYVTPTRPYYQSEGGYGGVFASGWISRRIFDGVSVAMYVRLDNVGGAVFEDSPLVTAENSYMVGAGLTWKMAHSKHYVKRENP